MSDWIDVAPVAEFGPGQVRLVDVDDVPVVVFNVDGGYFALENICSHDGSPLVLEGLESEAQLDGGEVTCPHHGARFCVKTGAARCPPAYDPAATFPVRVERNMVQVKDDRWD